MIDSSRPLLIAHVVHRFDIGGLENGVVNLINRLPESRWRHAVVALTDVSPENGGLILYPGTHRCPLLPVEPLHRGPAEGQDPNGNNEQSLVPPQFKPVDAIVPKGAVVFLHAHVVHESYDNRSADHWRYALLNTYIRRGWTFRPGRYAQRSEVDVYTP